MKINTSKSLHKSKISTTFVKEKQKYMKELIKTVLVITIIFAVAKTISDSFLSGWVSSVVCYLFLDITSDKK